MRSADTTDGIRRRRRRRDLPGDVPFLSALPEARPHPLTPPPEESAPPEKIHRLPLCYCLSRMRCRRAEQTTMTTTTKMTPRELFMRLRHGKRDFRSSSSPSSLLPLFLFLVLLVLLFFSSFFFITPSSSSSSDQLLGDVGLFMEQC